MPRAALLAALLAGLVLTGAPGAGAEEMTGSLRPLPNPFLPGLPLPAEAAAGLAAPAGDPAGAVLASSLRPRARAPKIIAMVEAARGGGEAKGLDLAALAPAPPDPAPPEPAPEPRSKKKRKKDRAAEREARSSKGSVCGVNAIKGEEIAPIRSKVKGCGLQDGVRVSSVSGVRLSQAVTIDCATAAALNTWVREVVQPDFGGDVVELRIAAHYICRPRNNRKGAKVSEHGRGKAVDVAAFVLESGQVLSVQSDYGKAIRRAHKGACGIFGTTLGPGSDGYHEDHLHLDTAGYRSGPYCR